MAKDVRLAIIGAVIVLIAFVAMIIYFDVTLSWPVVLVGVVAVLSMLFRFVPHRLGRSWGKRLREKRGSS